MPLHFLGPKGKILESSNSMDFVGSVHTHLNLDASPDGIVITLPRTFAWNSISVYCEPNAVFTLQQTLSSPEEIEGNNAHWIEVMDFEDKTDSIFYMWEWPIIAFKINGTGKVHFDLASKQF